ncbi:hypothetical protein [Candidatus Kuenenia stuttgartiensis]|uniref:hypothetical protein n=1 Tax=Kuenenia stuttgartiensis TaxID=174633 RepID=UPI00146EE38D|nr:hypothetical protein [Candidatus Kuenenia stuttgartiensis]
MPIFQSSLRILKFHTDGFLRIAVHRFINSYSYGLDDRVGKQICAMLSARPLNEIET